MPQNALAATIAKLLGSNAQTPLVAGKQLDLLNSELHGRKYTQSYLGNRFGGANSSAAGVTTSAGLATTYLGLCLSNPAGNTKNLVIGKVSAQFIVAPATVTAIGLIVGYSAAGVVTHTTPLTPLSKLIGSTTIATTAKLDSACTIVGTPAWLEWLTETLIATDLPSFNGDMEGSIVLPPGAYCAIGTSIAGPASGFVGSFDWEEVPV